MKTKHEVMAGHKRNANKRNVVFKFKKKLHHQCVFLQSILSMRTKILCNIHWLNMAVQFIIYKTFFL